MQFDFGQNWIEFAENTKKANLPQAREHFESLFSEIGLQGKHFLDIGFGQGLTSLIASEKGAFVTSLDINPKCLQALNLIQKRLFPNLTQLPKLHIGSILDDQIVSHLGSFDIVHTWGVLHHTGNLEKAMTHAIQRVGPRGYFICALYNRHWSSPIWKIIKWIYCKSPPFIQKAWIALFYPMIWIAKFLVTGRNPKKMSRGMEFTTNVIDWIGGYPYEYLSQVEMTNRLKSSGFTLIRTFPPDVPTGCNEFVFQRSESSF